MPKYFEFKVTGYYLYFTSFCIIECMHVHASDKFLTEKGSAKFFVKENGDSILQNRGILNDREFKVLLKTITKICISNGLNTAKMDFLKTKNR